LRVKRTDGLRFDLDPIYGEIRKSLGRLAEVIRDTSDPHGEFINPLVSRTSQATGLTSIALSHPLGGCRMAKSAADGVADEFGCVFDKSRTGDRPYYENLYVVDGSIIAIALGVNPSLTIAALSLRAADRTIADHRARHP
jgi:choline dehydrogenase-like flavoprotein